MSCPDWNAMTAHRRTDAGSPAAEPDAWAEAMDHLDDCAECRDRAIAADPSLIFRRLPAIEAEPGEIADIRAGVAALRRAGRVAEPVREAAAVRLDAGRSSAVWARVAAAGVLAGGLLTLQPSLHGPGPRAVAESARPAGVAPMAWLDDGPAVDDIENPTASVYHFDDEDVAVVMVVDAGLDV